ncbi:hypothetical protein FE257_010987 [Aspergillus nanangensis]|uniref:SWI/SNF family DNA-dependent ATPase Ris1 n=1 Tax=Aspergillus nanangensis TaxID=2582783 RepID=A0AAD4CI07_ASPNN|nr:hypothetical protein FE257_010987 [Aspergillus nanangensis]
MASANASIEDVLDDLELNHAILQSLDEQRPDLDEEKQDVLEVIRRLEVQLAELRGVPVDTSQDSSLAQSRQYSVSMPAPQLDGPSDFRPDPPRWGSAMMSPPARPSVSTPQRESSRSLAPLSIRKRSRLNYEDDDSDDTDDLEIPSKRVSNRPSASPSTRGSSPKSSSPGLEAGDEGTMDLRKMLGISDPEALESLQEEQRKAERWLQERKEQERRDEEFARRLMEDFNEQSRPPSSRSDSTHYTGPLNMATPPRLSASQSYTNRINLPPVYSLTANTTEAHRPAFGVPTLPNPYQRRAPPILVQDSDDSDIAEISARDFHPHGSNPLFTSNNPLSQSPFAPNSSHQYSPTIGYSGRREPLQNLYPSMNTMAGPSDIRAPGPAYGPSVLQNTMARLNSGKQLFENVGKSIFGDLPNPFSTRGNSEFPLPGGIYPNESDYYGYGADPKKTNDEIKQLLEAIRPDSEIAKEAREGTPEALRFTLLEHQKLGLSWMKSMEEKDQKGGILADDMGLGKTIQAIALMVSRPSEDPQNKTTLIIAPVALMQQWKREIQRILKPGEHQLSIYVLHGDKRAVTFKDLKKYDVVLTTFGTLSSELKRKLHYEEMQSSGASEQGLKALMKGLPCLGPQSKWYRIIIDEAQCIKNRNTKAALAACRLHATYRWCMSGTPMMNNVEELHSLLRFLRTKPYSNLERFNHDFTRPLKGGNVQAHDKAMTQLQVLLKAVLLRRTKESKIDGRPILQLPQRINETVHAVFSDDEQELYNSLEARTQLQFNRYLAAGTVGRNYSNILVLLLRLRQACCHPHLITDFSIKLNANTDELDLVENANAFSNEVVIRLKDNSDMECPICIDAVENPIIFFPCGHSTCAECFSRISDPALAVRQGHDGSVEVKCPNCRGKIDPKKITDHVSFKKVHYGDSDGPEDAENPTPAEEEEEQDGESDDDDDDDDDNGSLSRFIVNDDGEASNQSNNKKKGKMAKKPKKTLAQLKKEASKNVKSKRKYLRRLEKTWAPSAKIEKALEILQGVRDKGDEKTIIFSQFTSLLDLLEVPIVRKGWNYRRYDGSMKPGDRNSSVLDFTDDPDCRIMLVSLKAGNSGLNLVAASQVIIFDPFWNPYIEEQAIDRAHRIGQMREVQVHRILVAGTVEDRILELQDKKRELIEGALDEKASKNVARLGTRELAYLFNVT